MSLKNGYIGTYASSKSFGIYHFTFDTQTGILSQPVLFHKAQNAKCVSIQENLLVAPIEKEKKAGIFLLDISKYPPQLLDEVFYETKTACFITQIENTIYTANYHEGSILIYEIKENHLQLTKHLKIAPKAGCHQILFHKDWILIPCLELDEIQIFHKNSFQFLHRISFPKGSGPRHGIFDQDHKNFYLVTERSNELFHFQVTNESFQKKAVYSILPSTQSGSCAAIRLSPDQDFLYISIREANSIAMFALENGKVISQNHFSCKGSHPRDFLLSPDGNYFLILNRTSNDLLSIQRNSKTGLPEKICSKVSVTEGVGIALI